jgi:hypothetical protein
MRSRDREEETTHANTETEPKPQAQHAASLEDRVAKLEEQMKRVAALVGE